jgi:glucose-1-phosphate thymidylyltransferase
MIYYSIAVLMLAGIQDIVIVVNSEHEAMYRKLLGDGSRFGVRLSYVGQVGSGGVVDAMLCADVAKGKKILTILGDNVFYGQGLSSLLQNVVNSRHVCIFGYEVGDPRSFGVIEYGESGKISGITEKPQNPSSNTVSTGLYFLDETWFDRAQATAVSSRGEYEIASLLESYIREDRLDLISLSRGYTWFDAGTVASLFNASNFLKSVQQNQGFMVGCLEEIAWKFGWIDEEGLIDASRFYRSSYGAYLRSLPSL